MIDLQVPCHDMEIEYALWKQNLRQSPPRHSERFTRLYLHQPQVLCPSRKCFDPIPNTMQHLQRPWAR